MFALVLVPLGLYIHSILLYTVGLGLLADELPVVLAKGFGYRDEQWRGCDDYFTDWCVAGVFIGICIVYLLRGYLTSFVY